MEQKGSLIRYTLLSTLLLIIGGIVTLLVLNGDGHFFARKSQRFPQYHVETISIEQSDSLFPSAAPTAQRYTGGPIPEELCKEERLLFSTTFQADTGQIHYLFIPTAEYAYKLYINGQLLFQCGDLRSANRISKFFGERLLIPEHVLRADENSFQLLVAPRGFQIELPLFEMGSYETVSGRTVSYTISHYGSHFAFSILSIFLFILFISLWAVRRPRKSSILIFALTCFSLGLAYLPMIFGSVASHKALLHWQISRIGFIWATGCILLFSLRSTNRRHHPVLYFSLWGILSIVTVLFLNCSTKYEVISLFMKIAPITITPTMLLVPVLFFIHYRKTGQLNSLILLFCATINSFTAMHDLILKRQFIDADVWLLPYGFFTMQIGIALIFILDMKKTYDVLKEQKDTLERNQQELIMARDAANSANVAKSQFLAKMSHEIRTPMNGVIGINDLLSQTKMSPEQQQYTNIIKQSSESLLSIINDILDFSKMEEGKMEIEQQQFNLRNLLQDLINNFQLTAREESTDLTYTFTDDIELFYLGDEIRIKQVFTNLLDNACKFTKEGTISIEGTSISKTESYQVLKFTIKDTGIGMSKKQLKTIFQSFTQADSSTTRVYGGTGLGLTICKQLVELMNGEIGASSVEGKGSTFWFTLRLSLPEIVEFSEIELLNSSKEGKEKVAQDKSRVHILMAEDNPVNQKVALGILSKLGYSVEVANNGEEALEAFAKRHYHLILMDCQMPILDGYETTQALRKKGVATPIIAMTANAMAGDREKCLRSGMNDYIAKPIRGDLLNELIEKYTVRYES